MDAPIAASLLFAALGMKFAIEAIRMLRSNKVRAVEDKITFYEKVAPLTKTESRRFVFGLGLCSYYLAWGKYVSPEHPPFTGRWAWLSSFMYQNFGSNGLVLLSELYCCFPQRNHQSNDAHTYSNTMFGGVRAKKRGRMGRAKRNPSHRD
jgi:hypothetical protein